MEEEKKEASKPSKISITNQNTLLLNGISKVVTNTPTEISVLLAGKNLSILGENLTISKLDVESGVLEATGLVLGMKFLGHKQKENLFKRIFG